MGFPLGLSLPAAWAYAMMTFNPSKHHAIPCLLGARLPGMLAAPTAQAPLPGCILPTLQGLLREASPVGGRTWLRRDSIRAPPPPRQCCLMVSTQALGPLCPY